MLHCKLNDLSIRKNIDDYDHPLVIVTLTDGWYTVNARKDMELITKMLCGDIYVGRKQMIEGAQLKTSEKPYDSLRFISNFCLKQRKRFN